MKRVLVFTLLTFYTALACGLNVKLHYCGGKLKNISLIAKSDESGCCGSKMKSKDCCKNKTCFLKVKDSYHSTSSLNTISHNTAIDVVRLVFLVNYTENRSENFFNKEHNPPVFYDNPIYLKNRVFII